MKMLEIVSMMLMMGVVKGLVKEVHNREDYVFLNETDFYLLCGVMRATTELWTTVYSTHENINPDGEKELNRKIDEIFFGEKENEDYVGFPNLPKTFKGGSTNRKEVCMSTSNSDRMPSASVSLASAILCLCTPTKGSKRDFCGFKNVIAGEWEEEAAGDELFQRVWGDYDNEGIVRICEGAPSKSVEAAKLSITGNITALKNAINTTGTMGLKERTCDTKMPCAKVALGSTWLTNLQEIENINLIRVPPPQTQYDREGSVIPDPTPTVAPPTGPETPATSTPESEPVHSRIPEVDQHPATLRAPEKEPKAEPIPQNGQEKTNADIPKNKEEKTDNPLPIPEDETSGVPITHTKWPLLTASLLF